jgi:hypothetical protein
MAAQRFELASTLDVFATVAEAVGVAVPQRPGKIYDSVSLLPLLTGRATAPPRNVSFFYAGATLMVRYQPCWARAAAPTAMSRGRVMQRSGCAKRLPY